MDYILNSFPIRDSEYKQLDEMFGDLAHYAAWQLIKKNVKNNHTDDPEDIAQELRWAIVRAGSYFKRQVYLEDCMKTARKYVDHPDIMIVLDELEDLWKNRTKHGANKQKFGLIQENMLEQIVDDFVPLEDRPKKDKLLEINRKFITYCKCILWNAQKSIGRGFTRSKAIRAGMVSLSEYDYLMAKDGKVSVISS